MSMILGVQVKSHNLSVSNNNINIPANYAKTLDILDSEGVKVDCDKRCLKSTCDSTCAKTINIPTKSDGTVKLVYI